jgi:hypothetical protein
VSCRPARCDRLATVLGVRALLPLVRVRSRTRSLAVLNRDAKTVVRLEVEQGQVVGDGRKPAALSPRLLLGASSTPTTRLLARDSWMCGYLENPAASPRLRGRAPRDAPRVLGANPTH